jgi:SAM-dependent methyltransferase
VRNFRLQSSHLDNRARDSAVAPMGRWRAYSEDPNAPEVLRRRREAVTRTLTRRLVEDRVDYLCGLAEHKSVLDIGVVDHTSRATRSPQWLHGRIRERAFRCLGVDVIDSEVADLRRRGYDVICADLTRAPLPMKFDLIIGGEVLEHLDSPGTFMANCAAMLPKGGQLVVTVPNPWYANVILRNMRARVTFVESADHVAWYEALTLYELGQRHNLQLVAVTGIGGSQPRTWKGRALRAARPFLLRMGVNSLLFSKSVIYEFVRA